MHETNNQGAAVLPPDSYRDREFEGERGGYLKLKQQYKTLINT